MVPDSQYPALLSASARRRRILFHFASVAGLWLVHLLIASPVVTLVAGGLVMAFTYVKLGLDELLAAPLRLSPLSFYFFWLTVDAGVAPSYAGYCIFSGETLQLGPWAVAPEDIASGYLIFLTGCVALHTGLECCRPHDHSESAANGTYSNTRFLRLLGIMYVVGLIGLMNPRLTDPLGSELQPLILSGPMTALSCFALANRELDLRPLRFAAIMALGTIGLVVGSLNSGSKGQLMFSLFPLIWFFLLYRSRWLPLVFAAGLVIYPVVFQVVGLRRANLGYYADKESIKQSDELGGQMLDAFQQWLHGARLENDSNGGDSGTAHEFLYREFQPLPVGFIAREVSEGGLLMGSSLDYIGYALVPRLLWPNKPGILRGVWFSFRLGMADSDSPASGTTAVAQEAAGELYWNFGILGVVAGMIMLGALWGRLWRMAGDDPRRDPLRMMLYIRVLLSLQEMPEAGTALVAAVAQFIIFATALYLQKIFFEKEREAHFSLRQL